MSRNRTLAVLVVLLAGMGMVAAQPAPDPRIADLLQAGKLRVGLFASQFSKDQATGELRGVRPDLARALAARMGVQAVFVKRGSPPEVVECLELGACDLLFLPKDARTAGTAEFSFPFIQSEFTFLVPAGSAIQRAAQADTTGIRIAAVRGHASTATLVGFVKQAAVVLADTEPAGLQLLRAGQVHAFASTRQSLRKISRELPGAQVLADRYGFQSNRMVVAKGRTGLVAYLNEFVEDAKASGLVRRAIEREDASAFEVAPPGESD